MVIKVVMNGEPDGSFKLFQLHRRQLTLANKTVATDILEAAQCCMLFLQDMVTCDRRSFSEKTLFLKRNLNKTSHRFTDDT